MEVATGRKLLIPAGIQTLLRDLIHERTGIFFDPSRFDVLVEKIEPLAMERNCYSLLDYYYLLKYEENGVADWARVMDALSVQETYFWREIDQIKGMAGTILPALLRATGDKPVQIWSVPCATGEEPLTIAMVLNEAGWFERAQITIHASDGSRAAVEKARRGRYRERAFRSLPPWLRDKYFTQQGSEWQPVADLQARVATWSVVNLAAPEEYSAYASSPIIFCRNAFIYFSPTSVKTVVNAFADRMPAHGYLFVGASESLLNITDRFRLDDLEGAFVYVKR